MDKVYLLVETDGYHPSVKHVFAKKEDAYAKKDFYDNDEEFQFRVFNQLYVVERNLE
jgi:hypothetical protein